MNTNLQSLPSEVNSSQSETSLDRLIPNNSTEKHCLCGGLLIKQANTHGYAAAVQLPCKSWNCPICGPKKGKQVWKRLSQSEVQLNRMVTLPFAIGENHNRTWQEAIEESGKTLNSFLTSLRRVYSRIRYFWVREIGGKSNMVHFHMLVDRYIPQSLLSALWARAGGGTIVDIRKGQKAYVFKYMVKYSPLSQEVQNCLKGKRRWSASRFLLTPPPKSNGQYSGWTWVSRGHVVRLVASTFMEYVGDQEGLMSFKCPMLKQEGCFT